MIEKLNMLEDMPEIFELFPLADCVSIDGDILNISEFNQCLKDIEEADKCQKFFIRYFFGDYIVHFIIRNRPPNVTYPKKYFVILTSRGDFVCAGRKYKVEADKHYGEIASNNDELFDEFMDYMLKKYPNTIYHLNVFS